MKSYILKFAEIGTGAGPFEIKDSTGATVATGVTRAQLLAGFEISIDDTATSVDVISSGVCTNTVPVVIPSVIGYLNYPGTTHVDTWVTNMQVNATNRAATSQTTIGAIKDYTIVESGVISGAQLFTVAGPTTNLGGISGGGTVILTSDSTINGGNKVEAGATLQLGLDKCATSGSLASGTMRVEGTLNLNGDYSTAKSLTGQLSVASTGVVNVEGCGGCGQGRIEMGLSASPPWAGISAGGVLNIKNAITSVYPGNAGTINVNEGASIYATTTMNLGKVIVNSEGWLDATCTPQPTIGFAAGATITGDVTVGPLGAVIRSTTAGNNTVNVTLRGTGNVSYGNCADSSGAFNSTNGGFTGDFTAYGGYIQPSALSLSTSKLRLGCDVTWYMTDNSGPDYVYKSLQSATPADTNSTFYTIYKKVILTAQDPEPYYGKIATYLGGIDVQSGNFQIAGTASNATQPLTLLGSAKVGGYGANAMYGTGGPLTVATATGGLSLVTNPSKLTVGAFTAANGFRVDIGAAYAGAAGTYTILTKASGSSAIPTTGVNASGLTATFAWVGNNLNMTLA